MHGVRRKRLHVLGQGGLALIHGLSVSRKFGEKRKHPGDIDDARHTKTCRISVVTEEQEIEGLLMGVDQPTNVTSTSASIER
jgi:hypothetical protein